MVSSLPPPFQRAKEALQHAHLDRQRDYAAQKLAWDAMEVNDKNEKILMAQEALLFYPFCADAWGILGYHYLDDDVNFQASIEAFQIGVEAARRVYPSLSLERPNNIYWGDCDYRPYLRVIGGLARAYYKSGQIYLAIETLELLLRQGCTDLNLKLTRWYIEVARWEDARRILVESDECFCGHLYNLVFVHYHFYVVGGGDEESDERLYKALGRALEKNIHVPSLLALDNMEHRTKPESYHPGGEDEALIYQISCSNLWKSTTGAVEWLLSAKERYGPKPNEEVFIQWLRKRRVYVEFLNRPAENVTQNHKKMTGTGLPDFRMRPECSQPHRNGSVICAQKYDFGAVDNWIEFRYEEVASVPYWSILLSNYEAEEQEEQHRREQEVQEEQNRRERNKKRNKKRNRNKKLNRKKKREKQREQQRIMDDIWSELNARHVSMIASFLSLKEKAVVRSLSKTWLESSTLDTKAEIDPASVGLDVNGALRFAASSFPRLRHFSLKVEQGYFLNLNDELWNAEIETMGSLQLNGEALRSVFEQGSIRLRSATINFDQCVQEHTSRILVEEEGLSTLHRQVSLQKLSLRFAYFESLHALSRMMRPLMNLQYLCLYEINLPEPEHRFSDLDDLWQSPTELMSTIGSLKNLRALSIGDHRITDDDLHHLSTLSELRKLELTGRFGDRAFVSLTDTSMAFIASSFPKLESLNMSYNRSITMKGIRDVIGSCPLRELQASEAGLKAEHLEEIVRTKPSIRFIRYGVGYMNSTNENLLRKASVTSRGRCVFTGNRGLYEPKFDLKLLANHNATKMFMEDLWDAKESNLYDD